MTTALEASSRVDFEWVACAGCRELVYGRRFTRLLRVCPGCGFHARLTSPQRMQQLLDPGTAQLLDTPATVEDPLAFADTRPYRERLREARARTSLDEAVLCARGTIAAYPLVVAIMDFRFLGGSLGCAVGERITCAAEAALRERVPLLLVTASGGARMQEGALSLMQMVKISQAIAMLDEAGIMTIALITDPTYGGVAASFATLPDVILAEPGAHVGFAGPRVIQQTIGQRLPEGFQTAEFVFSHGLVDGVTSRAGLRPTLAKLLHGHRQATPPPPPQPAALIRDPDQLAVRNPWEVLQLARHPDRPTTLDYVEHMLEDFQELHGDRLSGDCPAIVGGLGRLDGRAVMLIGHQKGHSARERMARNFGMPTPAGYRKAARLMRLAAKLALPVVTLIDTPGAYPGVDAEQRGQAWAIAENLRLMSDLPVPVVAMVTGEGGSGGALALGVANCVLALSNAVYSVISPEGCAAILWKSSEAAPQAAAALGIDSQELLRHRVIDAVVPEPEGGAHRDPVATAGLVQAALSESLHRLARVDPRELVAQRRRRFRIVGCGRPDEG